jgi:hypothetical protein
VIVCEDTPTLRIAVLNTGAPFVGRAHGADGGVGLQNLERRLACY